MIPRPLLAAALAALGAAALATPARSALSSLISGTPTTDPARVGPELTPDEQPRLSDDEQARATTVARSDARLRTLLGSQSDTFTVTDAGPWTTMKNKERLGAVLTIHLPEPATLRGAWPIMRYAGKDDVARPYQEHVAKLQAKHAEDLLLLVDLTKEKLVGVVATPGTKVQPLPGETPLPKTRESP